MQSSMPTMSAIQFPSSFVQNEKRIDSNELHGFTFNQQVEASHWSRKRGFAGRDVTDIKAHELMYHGISEWTLRLLSHGRFISTVPTRSVAESVFTSQLLSAVRKSQLDLDAVASTLWQNHHPGKELPSKTTDVSSLYAPLINDLIGVLKKHAPAQVASSSSQQLVELQTALMKREQQLMEQGVVLTPKKNEGQSTASASDDQSRPKNTESGLPVKNAAEDDCGPSHSVLSKLDKIPSDIFKSKIKSLEGPSTEAVQTWIKTFKKSLGASKFSQLEGLITKVDSLVGDKEITKERMQDLALKFGMNPSTVTKLGFKSLSSVIALAMIWSA